MTEQPGTPQRDNPDDEDFEGGPGESISDQQGETAPPGADRPQAGDDEPGAATDDDE
jgi:hypothetical protein